MHLSCAFKISSGLTNLKKKYLILLQFLTLHFNLNKCFFFFDLNEFDMKVFHIIIWDYKIYII